MDDTSQRIAQLFDFCYWISASLNPNLGKSEPPANVKVVGLLAYADNINWAPGTAAGLFVWNGSAWKEFYGTWNLTPYTGPTTQSDVTASRTIGTVYQNTTGKPMWVTVSSRSTVYISNYFKALTDSSNPPTTVVANENPTSTGANYSMSFIVLINNYYKVTHDLGTPTLEKWVEWY